MSIFIESQSQIVSRQRVEIVLDVIFGFRVIIYHPR